MAAIGPDVGRDYQDRLGQNPHFRLTPLPSTSYCGAEFEINYNGKTLRQPVWYAHLALLKLVKDFQFNSVLDIGSNDGMVSHIFDFLGKKTVALEPGIPNPISNDWPVRTPDIDIDFLDAKFNKKFEAIWCSHVLEHVRNTGQFLDKLYDDLVEGGVLAITVPFNDFGESIYNLLMGHHSKYNHWLLLYQLVCAGFNCRNASVAVYMGQISIVVKKVPNNVQRSSCALYCPYPPNTPLISEEGRFFNRQLLEYFPYNFIDNVIEDPNLFVNWNL